MVSSLPRLPRSLPAWLQRSETKGRMFVFVVPNEFDIVEVSENADSWMLFFGLDPKACAIFKFGNC